MILGCSGDLQAPATAAANLWEISTNPGGGRALSPCPALAQVLVVKDITC